jgi:hypothetical protein
VPPSQNPGNRKQIGGSSHAALAVQVCRPGVVVVGGALVVLVVPGATVVVVVEGSPVVVEVPGSAVVVVAPGP